MTSATADFDSDGVGFNPGDPTFIADPYPVFETMRAIGPVLHYPPRDLFLLTRFADVSAALRDRRLGRACRPRGDGEHSGQRHAGFADPPRPVEQDPPR